MRQRKLGKWQQKAYDVLKRGDVLPHLTNTVLKRGDVLVLPHLANTRDRLARVFYKLQDEGYRITLAREEYGGPYVYAAIPEFAAIVRQTAETANKEARRNRKHKRDIPVLECI